MSIFGSSYRLRVDDWPQAMNVFAMPAGKIRRPDTRRTPELFIVLPPAFIGTNLRDMRPLLLANIEYHLKLGVTGLIIYATDEQITEWKTYSDILRYVDSGEIILVRWVMRIFDADGFYTQHFAYAHALLAGWGTDTRLAMFDVDELLAVPEPIRDFADLLRPGGCMHQNGQARLIRYENGCGDCTKPLAREWNLSSQYSEFLKRINLRDDIPLVYYEGKAIFHPDFSYGMFIHEANQLYDGTTIEVAPECAFVVHLTNVFSIRTSREKMVQYNASWHWVFDHDDKKIKIINEN